MIDSFRGEYWFLSNFSEWPFTDDAGLLYRTSEHYYQAFRAADHKTFEMIRAAVTPGAAKKIARQAVQRPDWQKIKERVMWRALLHKFTSNKSVRLMLLATGDEVLIEGNTWHDNYWGVCYCGRCDTQAAKNQLGNLLMMLREGFRFMSTHSI